MPCFLGHKFNILYEACSAEKYNILLRLSKKSNFCLFLKYTYSKINHLRASKLRFSGFSTVSLSFCTFMDTQKPITTDSSLESKNDFADLFNTNCYT